MLKEKALQDTSVPFPLCLPCVHQQPEVDAELQRHRWRCSAVKEFKPEQLLPHRTGGKV